MAQPPLNKTKKRTACDIFSSEQKQQYKKPKTEEKEDTSFVDIDRCKGLLLGAAIGDSVGSYCEMSDERIPELEMNFIMEMPGGGFWGDQVIAGQVTDDTEMAVALAYALSGMSTTFDIQTIAKNYAEWHKSKPFDQGFCTREVLNYAPNVAKMQTKALEYNNEKVIQYKSDGNCANGALMRCMPLILYGFNLDYENLYLLIKTEAELTHNNIFVFLVNMCYAIMVLYLLKCEMNEPDKHLNAYNTMHCWLSEQTKSPNLEKSKAAKVILTQWLKHVNDKNMKKLQIATVFKGFVKIAFQRVCYHLINTQTYFDAIKSVVSEGGDTDTNACIVGGMMGALFGLHHIPNHYIDKIAKCDPASERDRYQPKWYSKDNIIPKLLQVAPQNFMTNNK